MCTALCNLNEQKSHLLSQRARAGDFPFFEQNGSVQIGHINFAHQISRWSGIFDLFAVFEIAFLYQCGVSPHFATLPVR